MKPVKKVKNNNNGPKNKKQLQIKVKVSFWTIILIGMLAFFTIPFILALFQINSTAGKVDTSVMITDIKEGKIDKILIEKEKLILTYKDGTTKFSTKEENDTLASLLEKSGVDPSSVKYTVMDGSLAKTFGNIVGTVLPIVLMAGFFYFIMKAQTRGAQDIFSFGRSRAKLFAKGKQDITFADVAGVDDAKKELEEVVDFLKNPGKYRKIGARTPKGVLLLGPSGVGKTLLAKALAGEANVPFFSMAGSEFMEMLVGVGASRVRDLFSQAKAAAPAIIFIDEIDAIGRQRGKSMMAAHDEREQTLNQILVEMDGFTPNDNVIVVAASVTGDTPVVVRECDEFKLVPIGEYIDQFYSSEDKEGEIELSGIETLGFERKASDGNLTHKNLYFGKSAFKSVRAVFRHKVKEIYEIEYFGGKLKATGSHSVFVRDRFGIRARAVSELKKGDVLIDLPFKVNRGNKSLRQIRAHGFDKSWSTNLSLFDQEKEFEWQAKYQYAIAASLTGDSQQEIAQNLDVSQGTIGNWTSGKYSPREISRKYLKSHIAEELPEKIKVTSDLCRLLGYYVAEGYSRWELDFCLSIKEGEIIKDIVNLMGNIFGLVPKIRRITSGAVNIVYNSSPVSKFFTRLCGKGAHNKHIPSFLFEAPYPFFREFLRGVWLGDGYEDKNGKGEITTVSRRLALEINWVARMHGIKTYPSKRAIVKRVTKLVFNGFVYDFCGVENEAFFGGDSPILLHNTNRGDLLDPALLRPGRFDRRVVLDMPDKDGRLAILKIHAKGKSFVKEINWGSVADRTVGFSGADLENMLNEAAILTARENRGAVEMKDIEEAATKVKLGPAKKRLQTKEDKEITAYHEAGHAIVTHALPKMDLVQRISIVARGMSLGHTLIPPADDRTHETKSRLLEQISAMLGGRAAEEVVFNEMTSGAANDIEQATHIARSMVMDFGMSALGPINWGAQFGISEFGVPDWYEPPANSPSFQEKIDTEVKRIVDEAYKQALTLIKKYRAKLDKVATALLKKETLDRDDFEKIVGKKNQKE